VEGGPARDVDCAGGFDQVRQIERRLEHAVGIGRSGRVIGSGGRGLAAGHGVDQIVDADDFQIDVAARGVNQMIAADGREIAVAGIDDHVQLGIRQLQSGGERNGAAVRGVERIELHVAGHAPGAADAGNQRQRSQIDFRIDERAREEFTVVPMPHPGHQMCGTRSLRRNCSTGLTTSSLRIVNRIVIRQIAVFAI
jgi:hypothetical protein